MTDRIPLIGTITVVFMTVAMAATGTLRAGDDAIPARPVEEALEEHTAELMSIPGVVGTAHGLCDGKPCINVFVTKKTRESEQNIPHVLDGHPVAVEEMGGTPAPSPTRSATRSAIEASASRRSP